MYCDKCGAHNPDNSATCRACGASLANPYQTPVAAGMAGVPRPINNYLVPAIFSTLCCCLPFGIVSIVYAAQVNGLLAGGNVAGAEKAAQNAKMWFWIAFGLGLVAQLAYFSLVFIGGLAGMQQPGR